jgi:hypothetical protein
MRGIKRLGTAKSVAAIAPDKVFVMSAPNFQSQIWIYLTASVRSSVRPLWIFVSILWRTSLANLLLSILLFGQQQPGMLPSQSSQAAQLPASGRTTQPAGNVSAQFSTLEGQGANVLQPSVEVNDTYREACRAAVFRQAK